jgi:hypothetical protein
MSQHQLLERLKHLDTCAVSDALDALQIVGVVRRLHAMWHNCKTWSEGR